MVETRTTHSYEFGLLRWVEEPPVIQKKMAIIVLEGQKSCTWHTLIPVYYRIACVLYVLRWGASQAISSNLTPS